MLVQQLDRFLRIALFHRIADRLMLLDQTGDSSRRADFQIPSAAQVQVGVVQDRLDPTAACLVQQHLVE